MVVYGQDSLFAKCRIWNGTSWGGAFGMHPGGVSGNARWLTLASDPGSDALALGVLTFNAEIWFGVVGWRRLRLQVGGDHHGGGQIFPAMAVAFEASGEVLATYAEGRRRSATAPGPSGRDGPPSRTAPTWGPSPTR